MQRILTWFRGLTAREQRAVLIGLAWAFKKEFAQRAKELLRNGTSFLWPLPQPEFTV